MRNWNATFCTFLFWGLVIVSIISCQSNEPKGHEAALPHHKLSQSSKLSKADKKELSEAKGKSAALISTADLESLIIDIEADIIVLNYWQQDCSACFELQQDLQKLQSEMGSDKLQVLSLNFDEQADSEAVDLSLRTAGISTPVFQMAERDDFVDLEITPDWSGKFPAFSVLGNDGTLGFYEQSFSKNELKAVLNSYF